MSVTTNNLKRASIVALFAVNAVGLVNSTMTTHTLYSDVMTPDSNNPTTFEIALIAPVTTGVQWILGKDGRSKEIFDDTPVSFLADRSAESLPPVASNTLGVAFAAFSAPGAWLGTTIGMTTGIATKYGRGISDVLQERRNSAELKLQ